MELKSLDNYLDLVSLQDVINRVFNNKDKYPDIEFTSAQSVAEGIINHAGEIGYDGVKNLTKLTDIVSSSMALGKNGKLASKKDIYDSYRNFSANYKYKHNVTPVDALYNERNELARLQDESFKARENIHNLRVSRAKNHAIVAATLGVAFLFSGMRKKLREIKNEIRYNKTKLVDERNLELQKMAIDDKLDIIRKNSIIFEDHGPWKEEDNDLENALGNGRENVIGREIDREDSQEEYEAPALEEEFPAIEHEPQDALEEQQQVVEDDEEEYETGARLSDYGEDNEIGPDEKIIDGPVDDSTDEPSINSNDEPAREFGSISDFMLKMQEAQEANRKTEMNRLLNQANKEKLLDGTQFEELKNQSASKFMSHILSKNGQLNYGIFRDGKFIINDGSEEFKDNLIPREVREEFRESLNNPKFTLNIDPNMVKPAENKKDETVVLDTVEDQPAEPVAVDKKADVINKLNSILGDESNYKNAKYAQSLNTAKAEELFAILDEETKEGGVLYGTKIAERYSKLRTKNIDRKKESFLEGLLDVTNKPQGKEEYVTINKNGKIQFIGGNFDKEADVESKTKGNQTEESIDTRRREEFFIKERINNILGDEANYKNPKYYQSLNEEKTQELFEILEEYGKEGGLIENTPIAKAYNNLKTNKLDRKRESLLENLMKSSKKTQNQDEYVIINENGKIQIYNDNKYAPKAEIVDLKKIEEVKEDDPEDFGGDNMEVDVHYKKNKIPLELIAEQKKGTETSAHTN